MTPRARLALRRRQAALRGFMRRVVSLAQARRLKEAEALVGRIINLEPRCHWGYFYRAGLRLARGEQAGAVQDFRSLERLPPEWALFLREPQPYPAFLNGPIHEGLARLVTPPPPWASLFAAFLYKGEDKWQECVAAIEAAVTGAPDDPVVLAWSGRLRYRFRLPVEGRREMERAYQLAPRCPWICSWIGSAPRSRVAPPLRPRHPQTEASR